MEASEQKALLVRVAGDDIHGLADLNDYLSNGWQVIETTPLGGGHATETVALVLIEQHRSGPAHQIPVAEREAQPAEDELDDIVSGVEEPVEGDGAKPDIDPNIDPDSG